MVESKTKPKGELAVWPHRVVGSKYVRQLQKFLSGLKAETTHGNQKLFLDDVFVLQLLAFFNPTIRSLRTAEDFSQTQQAQKHLSIRKICKSTLSDFQRLAEPERLQPIINALQQQVGNQEINTGQWNQLLSKTVAVDGTFIRATSEVTWAMRCTNQRKGQRYRARLDFQIGVDNWIPEAVVVAPKGQSESESAIEHMQSGKIYLYDRGLNSFKLINAHYQCEENIPEAQSHFVMRYRTSGGNSPPLVEFQPRELTEDDQSNGVVSDRIGKFVSSKRSVNQILDVALREVLVSYSEDGETKTLRLITNLMDVSASTIAALYRQRWQVELFFRWLKCFGNFNHLMCHTREGATMCFYVAVIAVMLMYLHTGFRPSKYTFAMMSQVASGGATLEEITPILRERERRSALARESQRKRLERKRKLKNA